jgi:hypothetical protein
VLKVVQRHVLEMKAAKKIKTLSAKQKEEWKKLVDEGHALAL